VRDPTESVTHLRYCARRASTSATAPPLPPGQHRDRVERCLAFADFEVKLGRVDIAGLAGLGDDLTTLDLFAALDHQFLGMRIGGDIAVRMAHEKKIAVAFEFIARIGNDAVFGRLGCNHDSVTRSVGQLPSNRTWPRSSTVARSASGMTISMKCSTMRIVTPMSRILRTKPTP